MKAVLCLVLLLLPLGAAAGSGDWPGWGGPNADFRMTDVSIADSWPEEGLKEVWRREVNEGYSAFVSDGKHLFTMHREGEDHDVVIAVTAADGKLVWEYKYPTQMYESQVKDFGLGPNASPYLYKGMLYTLSFDGQVHCLDASNGKKVWSVDLIKDHGGEILRFGNSAGPRVYQDKLFVLSGGKNGAVLGLDLKTGAVVWNSDVHTVNYAAPVFIKTGSVEQVVFMAAESAVSVSLETGKTLWEVEHKNQYKTHAAMPMVGDNDLLFIVSQSNTGFKTLKLSENGGKVSYEIVNEGTDFTIFYSNSVRVDDVVYGSNRQLLQAVDVKTGKRLWRERGFPRANLLQVGDKWISLSEEGELSLLRLSPEKLEVLAKKKYLEKPAWTVPLLMDGMLYLRDKKTMLALKLP